MNLHEYQGKEILKNYGVEIQRGLVTENANESINVAKELTRQTNTSWYVIKAQIHAGGRGKGGGVKLAKNLDDVEKHTSSIIGMQLITPQTDNKGKKVNQVLIAEDVYYPGESDLKEFYISVLLNRQLGQNMIVYTTEGGMDIEEVAEKTPHLIHQEIIDPFTGVLPFQARRIAFNLKLKGVAFKNMVKFITNLYKAYEKEDASLLEINPVLKTSDNRILAVDCKITIDDNALYRHKKTIEMRDIKEEHPTDVEAKKVDLNYIELEGDVGCMVNGAGLAMATMDLIKQSGGSPANFLDVGGTADANRVKAAFEIILKDINVKTILVNIFGGIVRCDRVAAGIVEAYKSLSDKIQIPIIVRLQGTNAEIAKEMIDKSGLSVHSVIQFKDVTNKLKKLI